MARKSGSIVEYLFDKAEKFPWWAGVSLALVSFIFFHWYSVKFLPAVIDTDGTPVDRVPGSLVSPAFFGQFVVPAIFLCGALASAIRNLKRKQLYGKAARSISHNFFHEMSRRSFEFLVGEYFRRRQFSITTIRAVAEKGMCLLARKGLEKYLIFGKYQPVGKAGVQVVEELYEAMAEAGATGGITVTSGEFTKDAIAFARAKNILLLDGREMHANMQSFREFELNSEKKTGRPQKVKWVFAGLLVTILSFCLPYYGKQGRSVVSYLQVTLERFLPNSDSNRYSQSVQVGKPIVQTRSEEHTFNNDHVRRAMEQVFNEKKHRQSAINPTDLDGGEGNYLYEIELVTGGWVHTDNAEVTAETVLYKSANGIVVSLNRAEVRTIKKTKVDD